jgi:hypothetical protein
MSAYDSTVLSYMYVFKDWIGNERFVTPLEDPTLPFDRA